MAAPYYITTAISYPNGRPHIGHAYEAVAADVIARFQRAQGRDVRFQTGTDEHGLKMAQAARVRGLPPAAFADEMSSHFRMMCDALNVSYDRFIRTSEPICHRAAQALWERMAANGDLYLGRYEGWYSVRDEAFYDAEELVVADTGEQLSPQGTAVEWVAEESWFFRLSRYGDRILALLDDDVFLQPESRRNEVRQFVLGGLNDLSVSRTGFDWGVKVPGDARHVMYVWVDALANYLAGLGWPDEGGDYARWWPADLHLIGKDIVRFHAVYWPAFLMSAGLPLPKAVFGHGFLLHRGEKMSKSSGNVVDPLALAERYGVDPLRWLFMREVRFGQDGGWSEEAIVNRANAELANSFGNLVQRVLSFVAKHHPEPLPFAGADAALSQQVSETCRERLPEAFAALRFSVGLEAWLQGVFACNQYVDAEAPWALRKSDPERMARVLATLVAAIRELAIAVRPVLPASADAVLDQVGVLESARDYAALSDQDWWRDLQRTPPAPVFRKLEWTATAA